MTEILGWGMVSWVALNFIFVILLQQCLSINLFSCWNPGHGQKGPINKVNPLFCPEVFCIGIGSLVFSGTQHGARDPCGVMHEKPGFLESHIFACNMGKIAQV